MALEAFLLPSTVFNRALYSRVLSLWFSDLPRDASKCPPAQSSVWFGGGPKFDHECHSIVDEALQAIAPERLPLPPFRNHDSDRSHYPAIAAPFVSQLSGPLAEDEETGLAMVIILDQMTRNTLRSQQALIYGHYDRVSRAVSAAVRARGIDRGARFGPFPPWRQWFYYPLMHSEALADHEVLDARMAEMLDAARAGKDGEAVEQVQQMAGYEKMHVEILKKFGRYPHRNKALGRPGTAAEEKWLAGGGSTFGT